MSLKNRLAIVTLPLGLLGLAHATASPLETDAAVAEATYESSLTGYVNDEDAEVGGWVEANERVGEIGGWRVYLRQAQEPMPGQAEPASKHSEGKSMPGMNHSPSKGTQ